MTSITCAHTVHQGHKWVVSCVKYVTTTYVKAADNLCKAYHMAGGWLHALTVESLALVNSHIHCVQLSVS